MPDPTKDPLQPLIQRWLQSDEPDTLLEQLCKEHPEHADALRSRLADLAQTVAPDRAGSAAPAGDLGDPGEPKHIGRYRILDTLGEGGMGTVYLAEQKEPVQRRVALKLIKLGMDTKAVVQRFEQERQALAVMDHEGIAKVYDVGTSERGQPYFVMELVKGIPLDEYCERNRLSLPKRLELMQQVCAAVQHAHQKGVIHRDLKPGNVLVSDLDGRLQIKIIDFGLAKAMGQKLIQESLFTELGVVMGTPEFMAPEQADPSNLDIDTRADVYSLGVMLYQLLVGQLPFSGKELREAGILGMQKLLREVDPPRPSTKLTTVAEESTKVAQQLRITPSALKKALKGDLDWVVVKALEKDRSRRYESANALASDLQRYLDHEPLEAGPPSASYRLQKLVRRNRGKVAAAALVLVALLLGGVGTYVQWQRAEEQRARAEEEAAANLKLAKENEQIAASETAAKTEAQTNLRKFETKVTEFNQLAGVVRYEAAVAGAEQLLRQPAWPFAIPSMKSWLDDCDELLGMREAIEGTIDSLRKDALPLDEAQAFLHDTLEGLLGQLDRLASTERGVIAQRIEWARQIEALSLGHPNADVTWSAVRKAIASSDKYAGQTIELRDRDVLGLVPLGPNPVTGYFEFYHLRSAWDGKSDPAEIAIPVHDPKDGSITVTGETGIVFVLLPGGEVTLGSQGRDENAPYYDAQHEPDEDLHPLTLSPFFLARHELTQGQWARLWSGDESLRDPSRYKAGGTPGGVQAITLANPVENVDWSMCERLLLSQGLVLPKEAQWEYGCRGGSTSAWVVPLAELKAYANLADATAKPRARSWTRQCEAWTDGHLVHAPVGSFLPNGFGLHDAHGNVWEWCRDWYEAYGTEQPGDGLRPRSSSSGRVSRGGSFGRPAVNARSACRRYGAPTFRNSGLGLRPARTSRLPD